MDAATQEAMLEEDVEDFIVPDDSEEEAAPKKRKRPTSTKARAKAAPASSSPVIGTKEDEEDGDVVMTSTSTTQQWVYDPENPMVLKPRLATETIKKMASKTAKAKPSASEPEARYPWLANMQDADRHPPDHPDYDPRTLYIPPNAWNQFSPFERQYWEIKSKWWDTVVFFKKGKF